MLQNKEKVKDLILWTSVIITYLFLEWIYNQHLLEILSLKSISSNSFSNTEIFGKIIASLGINLFFLKLFKYSKKTFTIGLIVIYLLLTLLFNYLITSFSNDFRYASYYSMLYRKDVLENKDSKKLLSSDKDKKGWYHDSILMSHFIFTLEEENWKTYENDTRENVEKEVLKLKNDKEKIWKKYENVMTAKEGLSKGYESYKKGMKKYDLYRFSVFKKQARREFLKYSKGIPPDLTEQEFYEHSEIGKNYLAFPQTVIYEGIPNLDIEPILGKDIPLGMNKKNFNNYFNEKINNIANQVKPNLEDIHNHTNSENAVAVLVIPPISIGLSLFSILLNISLLIYNWLSMIPFFKNNMKLFTLIYLLTFLIGLNFVSHLPNSILYNQEWENLESSFQQKHPVLSYFWNFTFKFEPYLCSEETPEIVSIVTDALYK